MGRNRRLRGPKRRRDDRPMREDRRKAFLDRMEPVAPIRPLTRRQGDFLHHLEDNELVFTLGPAGTGKTYLAAASAADALACGDAEKLILCRPAVGADENHGFLPGDIGRKMEPWVIPFTEVISKRLGRDRYRGLIQAGRIEIVPFAFMRGRTFEDSFVILDEAQNTTYAQMKMFLTRIGEGSTTVVNGDVQQTDLQAESGLAVALRMIAEQDLDVPVVEFQNEDVVRSGVCRMWTEAFAKHERQ